MNFIFSRRKKSSSKSKDFLETGILNLIIGMATPIAFATPVCALAFSGKAWADKNLLIGEITARKAAVSGCVGGGVSALLACPSERVKVILQNNPKVKSKSWYESKY